jgi:hypothetical protein
MMNEKKSQARHFFVLSVSYCYSIDYFVKTYKVYTIHGINQTRPLEIYKN